MSRAKNRGNKSHRLREIALKVIGLGHLVTFQQEEACPSVDVWEGLGTILTSLGNELHELSGETVGSETKDRSS